MELGLLFVFLLIPWIALSVLVATWAKRQGHSFIAYLLIGLLASPAISLIVLLVVSAITGADVEPRPEASASSTGSHLDELKTLSELRNSGTLSTEEFETEKAPIMEGAGLDQGRMASEA